MNPLPPCILYTQDHELYRRLDGFLKFQALVRHVDDPTQLESVLRPCGPILIFFDLRAYDTRTLLPRVLAEVPTALVVALTDLDSAPAREVRGMGVYAVESLSADRGEVQDIAEKACAHIVLMHENHLLKKSEQPVSAEGSAPSASSAPLPGKAGADVLGQFFRASRHFKNIDAMLDGMVEGIAASTRVARVGVFVVVDDRKSYRFMAGAKCLEGMDQIRMSAGDPLVVWMQINAHLISRVGLPYIQDDAERMMLNQWLDRFGAEVIIPLYGREGIDGWVFVGRRTTGESLGHADLENLSLLGDYVSTMLENALLYERVSVQNSLTGSVFSSIPVGVVVVGTNGEVHWLNRAASTILGVAEDRVVSKPVEQVSSRLAAQIRQCIDGEVSEKPQEWIDPATKRALSTTTHRLVSENGTCTGAVALVDDLTQEHVLKEEQENVERTIFWTELAAALSHEVRNPLVAISTFAQLLPTRYNDPEFRGQFSTLVSEEIARLNGLVDQISSFANRPSSSVARVDVDSVIEEAISLVGERCPDNKIDIQVASPTDLPAIKGDKHALADSFAHLLLNSIESLGETENPRIRLSVSGTNGFTPDRSVLVRIQDNGPGIEPAILDRVYSPFFTTKPRGIGLGFPIVKRTVDDHNGELIINSSASGGDVTVTLPALGGTSPTPQNNGPIEEARHEEDSGS